MKSLEVYVKPTKAGKPITLHLFSCLHIGHSCHERELTLELLDTILNTPDHYAVNLGDTIDCGLRNSPGASVYEQVMNPRDQLIVAAALLRPLVDKGKILWACDSNHSMRTFKETGFFTAEETLCKLFFGDGMSKEDAKLLRRYGNGDIPGSESAKALQHLNTVFDRIRPSANPAVQWGGYQAMVRFHVGNQIYMLHSTHGEGSGVGPASALGAVIKQKDCADAEIYLRGHHHKMIATKGRVAIWNGPGKPAFKTIGYVTTGCMLGYNDSYGEMKSYAPQEIGMSKIIFQSNEHKFDFLI